VLPKPLEEITLLARVRNLLRAHGLEEELRRRQGTAAEFGFHETQTEFTENARILLIRNDAKLMTEWTTTIQDHIVADVTSVDPSLTLEEIGGQEKGPDVIVIPAELNECKDCLTLIAELRSRAETRHSAIIVTYRTPSNNVPIAALDIGANDLLEEHSLPEEIAIRIATQLKRKRSADRLRTTLENGLRLAVTDPLTGLFNRRYALPQMSRISIQSQNSGNPFAIKILDLDRFKLINDTHGQAAGDTVLKEIAQRLKNNLRSVDLICRVGGEEFLVVMPDTNLPAAQHDAERLRRVTEADAVASAENGISVTLSIGVSIGGFGKQASLPVEKIFDRADQALLGAKSHGRNQVQFSRPFP
jgi:two-component system cell cycle response regulator